MVAHRAGQFGPTDVLLAAPFVSTGAVIAFGAVIANPVGTSDGTAATSRTLLYTSLAVMGVVTVTAWGKRGFAAPYGLPPLLCMLLSFLPAIALVVPNPYAVSKVEGMLTVTPLAVFGAMVVIDTPARRMGALWVLAGLGMLGGLVAAAHPDPYARINHALALPGNATISTARLIGYGILAMIVLAVLYRCWLIALLALPLLVPLLLTGSRGPTVALLIASVLFAAMRTRGHHRAVRIGGIAAASVVVGSVTFPLLPADLSTRFQVLQGGPLDISSVSRLTLFQTAWQSIGRHPQGIGWGNFATIVPPGAVTDLHDQAYHLYAHNFVLEVGAEGGVVALAGLAVLAAAVFRAGWANGSEPTMAGLIALLAYAVVNAMTSSDINGNILVWVFAGIVLAGSQRRVTTEKPQPKRLVAA